MRALWQRHGHNGDNVGNRLLQFDSWQITELHDQLQTREEVGIADNHINQHIDYCLQREHVTKTMQRLCCIPLLHLVAIYLEGNLSASRSVSHH